jgi:predicted small lipoprotein YifL
MPNLAPMSAPRFRLAALLLVVFTCVACGNKGSLYLPEDPPTPPAPAPQTAADPGAAERTGGDADDDENRDRGA